MPDIDGPDRDLNHCWRRGLDDLEGGRYWEAHESWEELWHGLPESAAREATQALIQFAAACYKVRQVEQGRTEEEMQRGMEGLVARARGHLETAESLDSPRPSWGLRRLDGSLDRLEEILAEWRSGRALESVTGDVRDAALDLADHLREYDRPVDSSGV